MTVRLRRSLLLGQEGEIREVPFSMAVSLIEDKSAEAHGWRVTDSGEEGLRR